MVRFYSGILQRVVKVNKPLILVAPLYWGMGHATRCIPLIREIQNQGADVLLAADEAVLRRVSHSVSGLHLVTLPGMEIRYSNQNPAWLSIFKKLPAFLKSIREEKKKLEHILQEYPVSAIISDNRYGVFSDSIPSILITHQLQPRLPKYLSFLNFIPRRFIKKLVSGFDEIWIPDNPALNLSGKLSRHSNNYKIRYTGILSRFEKPLPAFSETETDTLFIISGPEPQAEIFFRLCIRYARKHNLRYKIIAGTAYDGNTDIVQSPPDEQFRELVQKSETIICRPGYSTLMDLVVLGRKAVLIPTPGQTEQEYLAEYFSKRWGFPFCNQDKMEEKVLRADTEKTPEISEQNYLANCLQRLLKEAKPAPGRS